MDLPPRPSMPTSWDEERSRAQADRLRIAQGQWDTILDDWVADHVDPGVKAAAWGKVDTSVNVLADLNRQLVTPGLYGRRPVVRHRSEDVEGLVGPEGLLEACGWYTRGQRLQYLTMCVGDMFARFSHRTGRLVYRFAYAHNVYLRTAHDDASRVLELRELGVFDVDGKPAYAWEVFRPEDEAYEIRLAEGGELGEDVTRAVRGQEMRGDAYPWRTEDGAPSLPYVHYQDADTGEAWNNALKMALTRGTMNAAMYATYAGQCARHATGSFVIVHGLDMPGSPAQGGNTAAQPAQQMALTPGAIAYHAARDGQAVGVHEVGPGVHLPDVAAFAQSYEAGQAVRMGLPASELTRQSANPSSAAALSISNEGRRDMAAQVEPMFRRCDLQALGVAAMIARLGDLGTYPETGYTIAYRQIPRTPTEQRERREELTWQLERGLVSEVDVYVELNPGATREDAIRALRQVAEDRAAVRLAEPGDEDPELESPMEE